VSVGDRDGGDPNGGHNIGSHDGGDRTGGDRNTGGHNGGGHNVGGLGGHDVGGHSGGGRNVGERNVGGHDGVRLALIRHGQTDSNLMRALDSKPPGAPLNELGLAQAAALGGRLATESISVVYASRAIRAQQTAAPVAVAHHLPVTVLDDVQEIFCGDLEGRFDRHAREQFDLTYSAWWRGELDAHLPGGESAHELRARFLPVIERITEAATGTVVLVSHGAAIRLAAAALLGDTAETTYVPNAGLILLRRGPAGWGLEHWDAAAPVLGDVTAGGGVGT
jgi:broad specificity phosphatase PhoE